MKSSKLAARLLSVVLAVMMLFSLVTVGFTSASAAEVEVAETGATKTIYLDPGSDWSQANAKFDAWTWGGAKADAWIDFADPDGDGIFEAQIESDRTGMKVVRRGPSQPAHSWNDKWNESSDLTIPTDGKNMIVVSGWNTFKWSTYVAPTPAVPGDASAYYLMGTLTDWATGQNMVYAEDTAVVTTTLELEAGSYTFKIKKDSNWYGAADLKLPTTIQGGTVDAADADGNAALTLDGGTYTFNYTIATKALAIAYTAPEVEDPETPGEGEDPVEPAFTIEWAKTRGLYAYAEVTEEVGTEAWQLWKSVSGKSYNYFYLPGSASADEVIIYNNYSSAVTVNGVEIAAQSYATVPYENGAEATVSGATSKGVKIMKTDAEGTVYVNNGATEYKDENKNVISNTDLYSFLTGGTKNREAKGTGAVASAADGVMDAPVKKIKGRGNSTWNLAKKPFNITHDATVEIDGMKGKKWSLLANAQDPSLLRNRLVYDMANEVGMMYACDSRFVDFIVNGAYLGSYQLTQKIEMGKNTVMPDLEEPEVEDVIDEETGETIAYPKSDFDFILELDTKANANNAGDLGFETKRGQWMTFKTPDEPADEQWAWMQAKYQAVEDALYGDTADLATLETLVDLDDMARAYLVNEVAKNLDAGVTSCYFVYNSDEGIFYLSPVWDYDNALGNSVSIADRHDAAGKMLDVTHPDGWYARDLVHYDLKTPNVFAQACALESVDSEGNTFWSRVESIWAADFLPLIDVLEGTEVTDGRLQTVDTYMDSLANSGQWNYNYAGWSLTANNGWVANHGSLKLYNYDAETATLSYETKTYDQYTLAGQANYAGDWMISRLNWLAAEFADEDVTVEGTKLPEAKEGYNRIFFSNAWAWTDVTIWIWDSAITEANTTEWPGVPMNFFETNEYDQDVYYYYVPTDAKFLIAGKDNGTLKQTPDITTGAEDCLGYNMDWSEKEGDHLDTYTHYQDMLEPEVPASSAAATTTPVVTAPATTTPAVTTPATTAGTTEAPEKEYITIYFTNAWAWKDVRVHTFGSAFEADTEWPGAPMTFLETNDYDQDVYTATVAADVEAVVFTGMDGETFKQSANIEVQDGYGYYMDWSEEEGEHTDSYVYVAPADPDPTTSAAAGTTAPATTTPAVTTPATTAPATTAPASSDSGDTPDLPTVVTVYAINSANWAEVYAYAWDANGVNGGSWPGIAMEKTEETVNGADIYALSFDADFVNVIFNNKDNGSQTDNLTTMNGQYYDIKAKTWYASLEDVPAADPLSTNRFLVGSFNGWSTTANEFMLKAEGEKTGYVELELEAGEYEFKIVREDKWTAPKTDTTITQSIAGLTFSSSGEKNVKMTVTEAGTYVFAFGTDSSQLSVTYPGQETPEVPTPDEPKPDTTVKLAGSFTEWGTGALEMTADETGKIFTISGIRLDAGTYEFKIVEFGNWLGNNGTIDNVAEGWTFKAKDDEGNDVGNATLKTKGGVYTFTFDTETDKLTVTAVLDVLKFDVTWNEGNFTVNAPASIDEATDLVFTVDAAEGYVVSAVIADMKIVEAVDGVYTIANVQGDIELLIITAPVVTEPEVMEFEVTFVDKDGNVLDTQTVEYGQAATAPEAPVVDGYTFKGWDTEFDYVTKDITVKATYKKNAAPVQPATTGTLRVEIAGGNGFTIAVDGGAARPQGASYANTKMTIGASVTVTAQAVDGATFIGWMNPVNGQILTTDLTYTFVFGGNDFIKASYATEVEGVQLVIFKNDKAFGGKGHILEMQYYASTDAIVFPDDPTQTAYDFTGWNMTEAEIQAAIAAGQDVTVLATWTRQIVYVNVTVNGGTGGGKVQANFQSIVTANAAPAGQKFAYWVDGDGNIKSYQAEYKFFPSADMTLTAVFVGADEAITEQILVSLDGIDTVGVAGKNVFCYSWYVPSEYTFVKVGILAVNKDNYNEATFVAGTSDSNVYDRQPTQNPSGAASWTKSNVAAGQTWMAKAYVQYRDASGELITVYSDIVEATKE